MDVRHLVFVSVVEEHPNQDTEEHRDRRHISIFLQYYGVGVGVAAGGGGSSRFRNNTGASWSDVRSGRVMSLAYTFGKSEFERE